MLIGCVQLVFFQFLSESSYSASALKNTGVKDLLYADVAALQIMRQKVI
jgi:hypothetical protein